MTEKFEHVLIMGCGHMGGALVQRWGEVGATETSADKPSRLPHTFSVVDRSPNARIGQKPLLPPRFVAYEKLQAFAEKSEVSNEPPRIDALLLAVRPRQVLSTLAACKALLSPQTTVISLAAGLPLAHLRAGLPDGQPLFRVMPSIPVAIGEGILLVSGEDANKKLCETSYENLCETKAGRAVQKLFAPMGSSVFCSEELLEKGTGLWCSAPGYVFHMMEAFEEAACALGYDAEQARLLAFQTFKGVGLFADQQRAERKSSPRELVQSIALEGGTTEAGLTVLADKQSGLVALMKQASLRAYHRAHAMAEEIDKP